MAEAQKAVSASRMMVGQGVGASMRWDEIDTGGASGQKAMTVDISTLNAGSVLMLCLSRQHESDGERFSEFERYKIHNS